jgi:hypothetical protein
MASEAPVERKGVRGAKGKEVRNTWHRRNQECWASEMPGEERSGNIRASERPVVGRALGAPRRKLVSEVRGIGGAKMKGVEGAKREELR